MKKLVTLLSIFMACTAPATALQPVDVELVLAVDVSGSMSYEEHEVQRRGFLAAFAGQELLTAIASGIRGRIAVTYIEWGGPGFQQIQVPWHIISDRQSARKFRALLAAKPRSQISGTSISSALAFSAQLFEGNGISSFRQVIDVSGDGHNREGPDLLAVREQVLRMNIVINGLPIMLSPAMQRGADGYGLDQYFRDCVIGGPSAFVFPVLKTTELGEAIRRKLILEISGLSASVRNASRIVVAADRKVDCKIGRYDRDGR